MIFNVNTFIIELYKKLRYYIFMKKNEEFIVECIDDTNQAAGVVKLDDFVVFVPNLLVSEIAKIKILKVQKTYAFGKIIELIKTSKYRINPKCPVFSKCGGCQYQYMDYQEQLHRKHHHLKTRVTRLLGNIEVREVLGMNDPFYYRNKAQFPVQIKDDKVIMGFYRQHSNDIIPCSQCMIQSHEINDIYVYLQDALDVQLAQGLRHIFIRVSKYTKEAQVVFIGSQQNDWKKLIQNLTSYFPNIVSVIYNENKRNDNVILGERYEVLYGKDHIIEECLGNKVKLHFKSFFQVNPDGMEILYNEAIKAANLSKEMTCIEMYSGVGTIGMAVSKHVNSVIGVEIVKEAVENARENCKMNHIENCQYICQDATLFAAECKKQNKKVDVLFVDPPRKGMSEQGIKDILTMNPKKVVYVSCNYETLLRDLSIFTQESYQCQYIQPVDMFAQTTGLECVALIERND